MSLSAEGLLKLLEEQREVFRHIVGLKSPTEGELRRVQQLAVSALGRDVGEMVKAVQMQPISNEVAYAGWHALDDDTVKWNETESFVAGVRFAEKTHGIG